MDLRKVDFPSFSQKEIDILWKDIYTCQQVKDSRGSRQPDNASMSAWLAVRGNQH